LLKWNASAPLSTTLLPEAHPFKILENNLISLAGSATFGLVYDINSSDLAFQADVAPKQPLRKLYASPMKTVEKLLEGVRRFDKPGFWINCITTEIPSSGSQVSLLEKYPMGGNTYISLGYDNVKASHDLYAIITEDGEEWKTTKESLTSLKKIYGNLHQQYLTRMLDMQTQARLFGTKVLDRDEEIKIDQLVDHYGQALDEIDFLINIPPMLLQSVENHVGERNKIWLEHNLYMKPN
jgi:hypothetical protein